MDTVGLLPAAGRGTRLASLPWSKELIPIGTMDLSSSTSAPMPKPVSMYSIEAMASASAQRLIVVINDQKWDILRFFQSGGMFGMPVAYVVQELIMGIPYAIQAAIPWIQHSTVLFGMPDTIYTPSSAFEDLIRQHEEHRADVSLGLFPTDTPQRFGMVSYDEDLNLLETIDKPDQSDLEYMWGIACWGPRFTRLISDHLEDLGSTEEELLLGDYFNLSVERDLTTKVLPFASGSYIDIGTEEGLESALHAFE